MPYHMTGGHPEVPYIDRAPYYEELNGDSDEIQVTDMTPDGGGIITRQGLQSGRPFRPENVPTKLVRKGSGPKRYPLLDVDSYVGYTVLVPQRFKDMVEELEPGVHQFFPMEIYVKDEKVADRYWFVICNRLDTQHPTLCPFLDERGFYSPVGKDPAPPIFSKIAIGDHHAWYDKFANGQFISDKFAEMLMASGMTGMRYQKFDMA